MIFICLYALIQTAVFLAALSSGGAVPAFSAFGTGALALLAAGGLRRAAYGTRWQKLRALCPALLLMGVAHWLGSGFAVNAFHVTLGGMEWGWLSFFLCLLLLPKRARTAPATG